MKLSINGIKEQEAWKKAGIALPGYDAETASKLGTQRITARRGTFAAIQIILE